LETEGATGTPRRFTLPALTALIEGAGLRAGEAHGLRIFSGLVPGALLDGDAGGAGGTEALRALEAAAAAAPPLRDIAAQLHLLGHRSPSWTTPAATSSTWTWTPSTPAWRSGTGPSSRAGRSSSAGPVAGAWCS